MHQGCGWLVVTKLKYSRSQCRWLLKSLNLYIGHLPKAVQTWLDAFANDPLIRYARQTPVRSPSYKIIYGSGTRMHSEMLYSNKQDYDGGGGAIEKAIEKAIHRLVFTLWIRIKFARTVDKGVAVVIA